MIIIDILGEEGDVVTVDETPIKMKEVFLGELELQLVHSTSERDKFHRNYDVVHRIGNVYRLNSGDGD
jgi:hypothetical protein